MAQPDATGLAVESGTGRSMNSWAATQADTTKVMKDSPMAKITCTLLWALLLTTAMAVACSAEERAEHTRNQFTIADLSVGEMQELRSFEDIPNEGPVGEVDKVSILAAKCYHALDVTDVFIKDGELTVSTSENGREFIGAFYDKINDMNLLDFLPAQSDWREKDLRVAPIFDNGGHLLYILIGHSLGDILAADAFRYRYYAIEFNFEGGLTGSILIF